MVTRSIIPPFPHGVIAPSEGSCILLSLILWARPSAWVRIAGGCGMALRIVSHPAEGVNCGRKGEFDGIWGGSAAVSIA